MRLLAVLAERQSLEDQLRRLKRIMDGCVGGSDLYKQVFISPVIDDL
jgi:hypothetical protein